MKGERSSVTLSEEYLAENTSKYSDGLPMIFTTTQQHDIIEK
jgi:hypothetical protein